MSDLETKAKENKSERDQELNDLRSILETEYGKRFLMRLIDRATYFSPPMAVGRKSVILLSWKAAESLVYTSLVKSHKPIQMHG